MRPSLLIAVLAGFVCLPAHAGRDHAPPYIHRWAKVEVFDRTAGHALPLRVHEDRLYVAGEPGHQYEVRVSNRSNERLLAVTSVDGVNVINGETADEQQSGYVLDPWGSVGIDGWRKNLDEVATFYFTRLSNSYAARTGRPENVGVIGVAVFREQRRCCRHHPFEERSANDSPAAPAASAESQSDESSRDESPGAESPSIESRRADEYSANRAREKLGTGHGHREASAATYVDFQRASSTPAETIVIYYDSRKNLVARGVIDDSRRNARRSPNPFPNGGFVPDP